MHLRVDNGMIRRRGRHALFVLVLAFLITGCASGGDVLVPPRADVAGIQVVVVFPFMNNTNQIGLEDDVVDRLVAGLQAVGWYEVVSRERVSEALAQHRASSLWEIGDNIWLDIARDIAAELGADGF